MTMGFAIFAAVLFAAPPPASRTSGNVAAVLRAERQFGAAVANNDTHAISRLTGDDWQIIDGDGHVIPRARFLQVIASGALKHSDLSSSDQTVRVYGNVAIVTGHAKSRGLYAGQDFSTDETATDVWIRTRSGWRCVLTQLTTRKP
ncbi:MAG: nuclear transport factor 2 family protein [Sphingomicrobium sp.]